MNNETEFFFIPETHCYRFECNEDITDLLKKLQTEHATRMASKYNTIRQFIEGGDSFGGIILSGEEKANLRKYDDAESTHKFIVFCPGCKKQLSYTMIEKTGEFMDLNRKKELVQRSRIYVSTKLDKSEQETVVTIEPLVKLRIPPKEDNQLLENEIHFLHIRRHPHGAYKKH